jgi:cellulose synthase/poly-beta-1,6-N-acetylglucosamine synthase-like glycosyltransferase
VTAVASIALAAWLYLLLARGAFWRCSERDDWGPEELPAWPRVAAVVPARNEADCVGGSIGSLLAQDYRGGWTVILVDDDSSDGTAEIARRAANADAQRRCRSRPIICCSPTPTSCMRPIPSAGWSRTPRQSTSR